MGGEHREVGAERLQGSDDLLQRGLHLRVSWHVGLVKMSDEPDTHPAFQPGRIMSSGSRSAAGIERIVSGDDVEHQRIVGTVRVDGPTWSSVKESGKTAATRNQTVSRLEPDDAAGAGRVTHSAACVAEPSGTGRQQRLPLTPRTSRRVVIRIPRVRAGGHWRSKTRAADRKFVVDSLPSTIAPAPRSRDTQTAG
jgi:hypothetical protein